MQSLEPSILQIPLLHIEHLERTNHSPVALIFLDPLAVLWPTGIKHDDVLLFVTDCLPCMKKAGATLKDAVCHLRSARATSNRGSDSAFLRGCGLLLSNGKKIIRKSPSRRTTFRELAPGAPLTPKPISMRWGTWLDAAIYYEENLQAFSRVINRLDANEAECADVT